MANFGSTDGLQPTRFQPTAKASGLPFPLPSWWQWLLIAIVLGVAIVAWFLLTATAVRFTTNADDPQIEISGGIAVPSGPSLLMRPGTFRVQLTADGYEPFTQRITVLNQADQEVVLELTALPGRVTVTGTPEGAQIMRDGEILGTAPLTLELPAGSVRLDVQADRYQKSVIDDEIIGHSVEQTLSFDLQPNWAEVTLRTTPSGAEVFIDDEPSDFTTPGPIQVLAGDRKISVKAPGYELWTDLLRVEAGQKIEFEPLELNLIGGTLYIETQPTGANIQVNHSYVGTSPLSVDLRPHRNHFIEASLFGYQTTGKELRLATGQAMRMVFVLPEVLGELAITTDPEGAEIWVNGELAGESNTVLSLHATDHDIELRKAGHASFTKSLTVQSEFRQELKVKLLTDDEARLAALEQARTTSEGQAMILLKPTPITMGASRRQPGRRSNEVFQTVDLNRLTYVSKNEVTNAEFRRFASGHDSGEFENMSLNKDEQPVVNVSWREAAQYCNWLSEKEDFEPFYILRTGDPPQFNPNSLGYRLPTEAEWAWAARTTVASAELLHFPWGENLPPPEYHGNYADRAAQHVIGRIIFNFNDNYTVSAPVETFDRNYHGLHDMGGNVSEWTHNFYEIPSVNATVPNLGPTEGEYHVIRGSSWMHGTITELRLSFRDYGIDGRPDVGFRLARYAE